MAAIPRELIESELFGHEKGAFTGATRAASGGSNRPRAARCSSTRSATCRSRRKPGCCGCCRRANSPRSAAAYPIRADVRIVAATHRDLRQLIRPGAVPRRPVLPPERGADPPAAAARAERRHPALAAISWRWRRREGLPMKRSTPRRWSGCSAYRWPGNVRELENLVRRLAALYSQEVIGVGVIEAELGDAPPRRDPGRGAGRGRRSAAPSSATSRVISPPTKGLAGRRALRPGAARDRAAADRADPGGDPRQPNQGRASARPQSQHIAQENPRIGHPGGPRHKIMQIARFGPSRRRRRRVQRPARDRL